MGVLLLRRRVAVSDTEEAHMSKLASIERKVRTIDTRRGAPVAVDRIRGGRLNKIRQRIGLRDLFTCQMCGRVTADGEVDHIVPLHMGGQETDENRQWCCVSCHRDKTEREQSQRDGWGGIQS